MTAKLLTFEHPPCDCCGPEVDKSSHPNLYEAMHRAEQMEGCELAWVLVVDNGEYTANTQSWWRSYEVTLKGGA